MNFSLDPDDPKAPQVLAEKEVRFFNDPAWSKLVNKFGQKKAVSNYLDLFPEIPAPMAPVRTTNRLALPTRTLHSFPPMLLF